jgi:hypothetical protein
MNATLEHSSLSPRQVRSLKLTAKDLEAGLPDLARLGIGLDEKTASKMIAGMGLDNLEPLVTTASITTPVQFLQNWLPGFVNVITAARKIDNLVGISTVGSWEDEEVVQGVMELTGTSVPYGDYNNIPFSSWNANWERRTVVRFEEGLRVGALEEARAARVRIDTASNKRNSSALALEIQRNNIGFYGFNNGANRTYGFLNDPSLPAYGNTPSPNPWATSTYLQITGDIREAVQSLRTQSQDTIDPQSTDMTLAVASDCVDYLSTVSDFGVSVWDWLKQSYPRIRVESAPQLNDANGGDNVFYLYAESVADTYSSDDSRTFIQVVPAKFQVLGVAREAKSYVEDYVNATAGVMCKRPYAVVRRSGC